MYRRHLCGFIANSSIGRRCRFSSSFNKGPSPTSLASLAEALSRDAVQTNKDNIHDEPALLPEFVFKPETKPATDITKPSTYLWTLGEAQRLIQLAEQSRQWYKGSIVWKDVYKQFPHRTEKACRSKYRKLVYAMQEIHGDDCYYEDHVSSFQKTGKRRNKFSQHELQLIKDAVLKYGEHNWGRVAKDIATLTGVIRPESAYSNIWNMRLCPKAQTAPPWTEERTERLRQLVQENGPDHVFLSYKYFPEYPPSLIAALIAQLKRGRLSIQDPRQSKI